MRKLFLTLIGPLIGIVIDVLINLIAAGIEKQPLINQLISTQGIWILVILVLCGLFTSVMLAKPDKSATSKPTHPHNPNGITITGSRFIGSSLDLHGGGIQIDDVTTVVAKTKADTTK